MGSIFRKIFTRGDGDNEDEILGCDMVPSPSVLATLCGPVAEDTMMRPVSTGAIGPFTTMAQAPIRDS